MFSCMYVCVKQGIVACISTAECLDTERVFLSFLYQSVRSVTSSSVLLKLLPGPTGDPVGDQLFVLTNPNGTLTFLTAPQICFMGSLL